MEPTGLQEQEPVRVPPLQASAAEIRQSFFDKKAQRLYPIQLKSKLIDHTLYVKRMSLAERAAYVANRPDVSENLSEADQAKVTLAAQTYLVISCVCDKDGNPIFSFEDADMLEAEAASVIDELSKEVMRANGLHTDSVGAAEKNSSGTQA
jgi:hypothetical protein